MFEIVLRNRSFFIRKNFSTKNKVILYDALQNLKYSKIAEFPRYKRSPEPLQMLRHILRKRKYNIILCKEKGVWKILLHGKSEPWDIGCGRRSAFNKSGIKRSKAWKYMRYNTQKIKKRFQYKNKSNINPNCYSS